jgi:uncharacterized damage-inducible protein DinB
VDAASIVISSLARNNAWANLRLHAACAALSEEDYLATRTSFFPSLHLTLTHILLVDWYYVDGLTDGGRGYSIFDDEEPFASLAPLSAAQREVDARLIAVAGSIDLDRPIALQRRKGPKIDRAGDILLHLFEHQIHHRGQAHAMLSGTPVKPPPLDEYFLTDDRVIAERELSDAGF